MVDLIKKVEGKIIFDSRGKETVQATVQTENNKFFTGAVPSGKSVGSNEAINVLPSIAVENINTIINRCLAGRRLSSIDEMDNIILEEDNTLNKEKLGANAILPVSIALTCALADANNLSTWKYISQIIDIKPLLPTPMMVMIEGGKHGSFKGVTWQEFLLNASVDLGETFINKLKQALVGNNINYKTGREGAMSIDAKTNQDALNIFLQVFSEIRTNETFSIDFAATHNQSTDKDLAYVLEQKNIMSIEDPAPENDWEKWQQITAQYADTCLIIGDDLVATNPERLRRAISVKACNGVIIKPNQIGCISETLKTCKIAQIAGIERIVSHRADETKDSFIADLAVGVGAKFLKSGAPTQPERATKYQRLNAISKELNG